MPTRLGVAWSRAAPQVFCGACLNDAGMHNGWWDAAKQKANPEELALVLGVVVGLSSSQAKSLSKISARIGDPKLPDKE